MSYAQLKKELPFPTKIVVVPMTRSEVQEAIYYSRNNVEENARDKYRMKMVKCRDEGIYKSIWTWILCLMQAITMTMLKVALPRNLLDWLLQDSATHGYWRSTEGRRSLSWSG